MRIRQVPTLPSKTLPSYTSRMTNDLPYSGWSNAALIATISAHRQQFGELLLKSELQAAEIERLNKANTELARKLAEVLRRQAASGEIVRLNLAALSEEQREKVYELIDLIKLVADGEEVELKYEA